MSRRTECPECLGSGLAPNRRDFCRRCGGIGQLPRLLAQRFRALVAAR